VKKQIKREILFATIIFLEINLKNNISRIPSSFLSFRKPTKYKVTLSL